MVKNNVIDFEAKKQELFERKIEEEVEQIESKYDFIRGELFVVEGLIRSLEMQKGNKILDKDQLLNSLYFARKDLSEALENETVKPIS